MDPFSMTQSLEQRFFNSLASKYMKGGVTKKKKKYRKIPKSNWFERLTVDECKQLCKAAKLPVSGSKGGIVTRLLDSEVGAVQVVESS
jgi:hypothetical protein